MTEIDSDTIKAMLDNARAQGEQQGKAAALAEQEAARAAAEKTEREQAQTVLDTYQTMWAQHPGRAANWMQLNGKAYEAACRKLRGQ